jgi:hypothetical protein
MNTYLVKDWFFYGWDFLVGFVNGERRNVLDEGSDTPIYDQLEREWARNGRLSFTLGAK